MASAKQLIRVIAAAILVFAFLHGASAFGAQDKATYRWKVGTLAPRGVGWAIQVEQIVVPAMDEATGGALRLKVYWGGVLGDDEDVLEKMRKGQLQCAGLAAQGTGVACPEFSVVQLPFLFADYDEVDHVRKKMFDVFGDLMRGHGFELYMWIDQDFDQIYSISQEFSTLEDFANVRFLKWNGPIEESLFKALGAIPVSVSVPEISKAMRQGAADAMIGPAIWMLGAQMHSVVRHVNPIKIRYSPATIIVSIDAWNKVQDEHIKNVIEIREDLTARFVKDSRDANKKCLDAMVQYGLQSAFMLNQDKALIRKQAVKIWDELAGDVYSRVFLDEILLHLQEYRARK